MVPEGDISGARDRGKSNLDTPTSPIPEVKERSIFFRICAMGPLAATT